jgi:hypothetical protein
MIATTNMIGSASNARLPIIWIVVLEAPIAPSPITMNVKRPIRSVKCVAAKLTSFQKLDIRIVATLSKKRTRYQVTYAADDPALDSSPALTKMPVNPTKIAPDTRNTRTLSASGTLNRAGRFFEQRTIVYWMARTARLKKSVQDSSQKFCSYVSIYQRL